MIALSEHDGLRPISLCLLVKLVHQHGFDPCFRAYRARALAIRRQVQMVRGENFEIPP